jgi:hypothetical protein
MPGPSRFIVPFYSICVRSTDHEPGISIQDRFIGDTFQVRKIAGLNKATYLHIITRAYSSYIHGAVIP